MSQNYRLGIAAAAILLALAACSKSSNTSSSASSAAVTTAMPATSAGAGAMVASSGVSASDGAKIFQTNCSSCHQANGEGVPQTLIVSQRVVYEA